MEKQIAVVTGGTKGIGLAAAKRLAKDGFAVYVGARNAPKEDLFEGLDVAYLQLDVSNSDSCQAFFETVFSAHGRIDVLVNNAGITRDSMTYKMTDEQFNAVLQINLAGAFHMTRLFGQKMQEAGHGSIINISSIIGETGNMGQANYAASKAGLIAMTKCWAREFSRKGSQVRVNAIAPGFIETDMTSGLSENILDDVKNKIDLRRLGKPEEIAGVVSFLAGPDSTYITGATIDVNGGIHV